MGGARCVLCERRWLHLTVWCVKKSCVVRCLEMCAGERRASVRGER